MIRFFWANKRTNHYISARILRILKVLSGHYKNISKKKAIKVEIGKHFGWSGKWPYLPILNNLRCRVCRCSFDSSQCRPTLTFAKNSSKSVDLRMIYNEKKMTVVRHLGYCIRFHYDWLIVVKTDAITKMADDCHFFRYISSANQPISTNFRIFHFWDENAYL